MRFFSNEAQDNTTDQGDRTEAVPPQRAGSPWHDTPAGDRPDDDRPAEHRPDHDSDRSDDPDAHRDPDEHDTAAHHHRDDHDSTADRDLSDDDTTRINDVRRDDEIDATQPINDLRSTEDGPTAAERHEDAVTAADNHDDVVAAAEERDDRATVDDGIEDRGTFDDPTVVEKQEPEPVVAVAAVPAADTAASGTSGPAPFFPEAETQPLRDRWRDIQLRFVDDPKATTGEAAALVDETIEKLTASLRQHRGSLASGADDTEALRVELRAYRDILDRLLGL
ncbi:hypothetical protein BJY16_002763 [Actinoplanes octamycinicus]|uniref:Uncharacterized protein n=1 Tax=Actinoplanes octamycinicus TaxID=135948 RepID=A0A7W7GVY4_9ACTN|nr:hypothetical protein [Actinoplanes octamycinicus]MBB4739304.1 hypothetical protein [Actinoplanes octamycinicus]GIE58720.1 hypothetical protein Aoc01nite_41220 [Actinoplanes octamycinicus]